MIHNFRPGLAAFLSASGTFTFAVQGDVWYSTHMLDTSTNQWAIFLGNGYGKCGHKEESSSALRLIRNIEDKVCTESSSPWSVGFEDHQTCLCLGL